MAFDYQVYKSQRIVPMRFRRAVTGQPVLGKPDIDDRGYFRAAVTAGNDHGHVIGVTEGNESEVTVQRIRIGTTAELFVTSSDTGTMTVKDSGGTDQLAASQTATLKIKGVAAPAGANPKTAKAEIRFGSKTGPIIGEISVWVFKKVSVKLTPHRVTIATATAAGVASTANVNDVINLVKAFWEPCGVDFLVRPIENTPVTLATAGRVTRPEVETLFTQNFKPGTINAYFVKQYRGSSNGTLGLGISRASATAGGLTNPGIILGDETVSGTVRNTDTHWLANDLAHEIGHFFTLAHVDNKQSSAPRQDLWALRMLMFPSNQTGGGPQAWHSDTGYGTNYRGGLITMKNLTDSASAANHSTDGETLIARGVINSAAGPY